MEQNQEIHELEQQLRQQEREIARLESIKTQTTEKIVKQGHSDQILEYLMAEILRLRSKQATIDSMDLFHPFDPIYQQEIANVQSKSDLTNLFIDLKRTKSKSLDQQHAKSLVFEAELLSANYKIVDLSKKRDENKKYEKRQLYRQMQQVHLQVQEPKVSRPIGHLTLSSLEPRMCKTVIPFDDFYRLHHSIVQ
ncbi:hypothetical protein EDD86DRAFT_139631 [Gorgonomyces haynaldii]|nr:hypothetical protein EDD86DRAFT_139631 [Gorgonomyces haynaldii]